MRRVQAIEFLAESKNALLLDVRSPAEYSHAHIPGAINLPLFTNDERKVVGTAYKQRSREAAIKIGLDYFGPKMREMVEEVERLVHPYQLARNNSLANCQPPIANSVFLYCWRGGMRSGAVAWLLNLYGFAVTVLAGGYKSFRQHVPKVFEQPHVFKILGGYTGSGKTEILQQLKKAGKKALDLEGIASHKGSAFGNLNMPPQPSQEMFENLLCLALLKEQFSGGDETKAQASNSKHQTATLSIWLEDESQRIGAVYIPQALWKTMHMAPVYFLAIPFEERLRHIVEEYGGCNNQKLLNAVGRISKRLGGLETKNAVQFLEEGKVEDCFRILLRYYDRQYLKGLQNRHPFSSLPLTVPCQTVAVENAAAVLLAQEKMTHAGTN